MTTRVLVTGAGGQVGRDLVTALAGEVPAGGDPTFAPDGRPARDGEFEVVACAHADLDVSDAGAVAAAIARHQPDVVVNLAAYTRVDQAEGDRDACDAANHLAVRTLSEACHDRGAHLITISTDYVFDGTKGAPYDEDDEPHPLNVYGATKLAGERSCRAEDAIVRTSWVMGARGTNVADVIIARVRRGEPVSFVTDQVGTVTSAADLARALVSLVRTRAGGLWHVANEGPASWFEVAGEIARCAVGDADLVRPITTAQRTPAPAARRPARSDLATRRWRSVGLAPLPPWRDAISRLVAAK